MSRADIVEGYARALAFGFEPDVSMLIGDFAMVQGERN